VDHVQVLVAIIPLLAVIVLAAAAGVVTYRLARRPR